MKRLLLSFTYVGTALLHNVVGLAQNVHPRRQTKARRVAETQIAVFPQSVPVRRHDGDIVSQICCIQSIFGWRAPGEMCKRGGNKLTAPGVIRYGAYPKINSNITHTSRFA